MLPREANVAMVAVTWAPSGILGIARNPTVALGILLSSGKIGSKRHWTYESNTVDCHNIELDEYFPTEYQ